METTTQAHQVPDIERLFEPTHDERARQSFISMLRKHAIVDMRHAVKHDYDSHVAPKLATEGAPQPDWRAIEAAMTKETSHRFYSSVRYNAREMCWLSVQPAVECALPQMIGMENSCPSTTLLAAACS